MHQTTEHFRKFLQKLPKQIQQTAHKNFDLLKTNPEHPSLHLKNVGKFWSVRIGINYRALAIKSDNDFTWVWIGTHDDYEIMIKNKS